MAQTLLDVMRARYELDPDAAFVRQTNGQRLTYGETWRRAEAVARALVRAEVGPGSPVAIALPNGCDGVVIWLAVHMVGAVDISINQGLRGATLTHALNDSGASVVFVDADLVEPLNLVEQDLARLALVVLVGDRQVSRQSAATRLIDFSTFIEESAAAVLPDYPSRRPGDLSTVIYTSGTTGPAKGVKISNRHALAIAEQMVRATRLTSDDTVYCAHPMFHIAGKFMALLASAHARAQLVLAEVFVADTWLDNVLDHACTVTLAHGPMIEMLCATKRRPEDTANLLRVVVASPLPAHLAVDFEQRFDVKALEVWGMTEVGVPIWRPYDAPLRVGSCGLPLDDDFEFAIVDPTSDEPVARGAVGELVLRPNSPHLIMSGYLNRDDATVEAWRNLWFHTGDLVRQDDEGFFYFVTRSTEGIRRRSENISPYEIERRALQHPSVVDCAAVGIASGYQSDDEVKLVLVPAAGAQIDPIEFLRFLAKDVPRHMVPRYLEFVPDLPRTPTNKVKRSLLREDGVGSQTWDRRAHIQMRELLGNAP